MTDGQQLNPRLHSSWYRDLMVCRTCGEVCGPIAPMCRRTPVWQHCSCTRGPAPSEMWSTYGIIFSGRLCRCCGQVLLQATSKFFVWFCQECKEQVGILNGRLGRYAIPIGAHSLMGGFALDGSSDDLDVLIFVQRWAQVTDATDRLREWSKTVVRMILAERWDDPPERISMVSYLDRCPETEAEKMKRFREMMSFLQRGPDFQGCQDIPGDGAAGRLIS